MNSSGILKLLYLFSNRTEIDGIGVGVSGHDKAETKVIRNKVEASLALIRQCDPRRYAYLKRDVRHILVFGYPGFRARWHQKMALCELTNTFVLAPETTPAILAAALAHEAMHARLYRWGFDYEEEKRARIEQICFNASIAFAHRLPLTELASRGSIIEENTRLIKHDPSYLTNESRFEAAMAAGRELGCPEWLISLLRRWAQRRLSQQK